MYFHKEWILMCAIKKNHLGGQRILGWNKYCDIKTLYIYTGIKQLSKWMADGGSEVSHCWSRRLQTNKGRGLELLNQSWKQYELVFSLIQIQTDTYRNMYRHVSIHGLVYTQIFLALSAEKGYGNDTCHSYYPDLGFNTTLQ